MGRDTDLLRRFENTVQENINIGVFGIFRHEFAHDRIGDDHFCHQIRNNQTDKRAHEQGWVGHAQVFSRFDHALKNRQYLRRDLFQQHRAVLAFEFDHLDEHQVHKFRTLPHLRDDDVRRVLVKVFRGIPFRRKDGRQDLLVRMLVNDDAFEDLILAGKVVVDSAQRQPNFIRDLAHGRGSVALFEKEFNRRIFDGEARGFAFLEFVLGFHDKNERLFVFFILDEGGGSCQDAKTGFRETISRKPVWVRILFSKV